MSMGNVKYSLCLSPSTDDAGAVHPGCAAQPASPAGGLGVRRPGLPGGGHLRLEEAVPVLLHPPPPRHHDCQPGSHNLDPQSHELHSGKAARERARLVKTPKCFMVYATLYVAELKGVV